MVCLEWLIIDDSSWPVRFVLVGGEANYFNALVKFSVSHRTADSMIFVFQYHVVGILIDQPTNRRLTDPVKVQVASLVMIAVGLLYNGVLAACSRFVGLAWTHDEGVVSKLPPVIWISCFANMGQAVVHIFSGALNGCRRQKEGSWVATLLYGLIGIPGPWLFALSMRWGVAGLWATKLIVVVLEMALLGALVAQLDWQQEVERAMEVVQRTKRGPQGNLPFARDGGPQTNLSISDDGESQTNLSMSRDGGSQTNLSISRDGGSQTNLSISYDGESQTNLSIGHDGINLSKGQAGGSEESE
eukprot:evm.model.scf_1364.3 EVM.evm.TU.scf_1364.3   scf_1364:38579-40430(-)